MIKCPTIERPVTSFIWFIFLFPAMLLSIFPLPVSAAVIEDHRYLETAGDMKEFYSWTLEDTTPYKLIYKGDEDLFVTRCDQNMDTQSWHAVNETSKTNVLVERRHGFLYMDGIYEGKTLKRKHKIGNDLWFQSNSLSLRPFILSDDTELAYWTIRPDNFKVYKLLARKVAVEDISVGETKVKAQKVELSLTGILKGIWKSHYWFRMSDGLFLRFEGRSGLPGNPLAIVNYVGDLP